MARSAGDRYIRSLHGSQRHTLNHIHASFRLNRDSSFKLDVDLELPGSGITGVFGPSGSGKTTLLRCIAGLQAAEGHLTVNAEPWQDDQVNLPTHKRPLGYVFQESSLFTHLSAAKNLQYAVSRAWSPVGAAFYDQIVQLLGLESLLDRNASRLSGGERQRVAIARALLVKPRLLLMDEPLASLDIARRQEILPYLERLHEELDLPVIYVSHVIDELSRLADYLVIMNAGRAIAAGPLNEVLSQVEIPLALGEDTGVVIGGRVIAREDEWHLLEVETSGGNLWLRDNGEAIGNEIRIHILARDVSLSRSAEADSTIQNRLPITVDQVADDPDSAMALVRLEAGSDFLLARITRRAIQALAIDPGANLVAQIKAAAILR